MDFAFAIMVASLPAFYRPFDAAIKSMRGLLEFIMPHILCNAGRSYRSSVRRLVKSKNCTTPSTFEDGQKDKDVEGGEDILLSSASHMGGYDEGGLANGQSASTR